MEQAKPPFLPPRIDGLWRLAMDLWWSWHPEAQRVFEMVDHRLWRSVRHNPVKLLRRADPSRLAAVSQDPHFLSRCDAVLAAMDRDLSRTDAWFPEQFPEFGGKLIAFFCAEFGLHPSIPTYAGGLGILAGDICKEASDSGLPLIGVGFMYPKGYFHQRVPPDGWQQEIVEEVVRDDIPVARPYGADGAATSVTLPVGQRKVEVGIWRVRVGGANLFLLDTDLSTNAAEDRQLSAQLYAGDQEWRLRQELVLGVGGVRALRAVGLHPVAWHGNEGHTAFMLLERLREKVREGASFEEGVRAVQRSSLFTTHTPVLAGHDAFSMDLAQRYLGPYCVGSGLDPSKVLELGEKHEPWGTTFNMTVLGMRLSGARNAVSAKHGEVCRGMWQGLWPHVAERDVPIVHVTNAIHLPTWVSEELQDLFDRFLGPNWLREPDDPRSWEKVDQIPDEDLWAAHLKRKSRLFAFMREQARGHWLAAGAGTLQAPIGGPLLDPDIVTICFAKRFASYKRPALLFHDPERLARLLNNRWRPVQLVFAGKAHPQDDPGKRLIQKVYTMARDPRMEGRIAFIEDYDMDAAKVLTAGVDLWLNSPEPPMEASGTSGMKALVNGVPQLSVLDGWWIEGFAGNNGWAVTSLPSPSRDASDAAAILRLLEEQVVPLFYEQGGDGVPHGWVCVMKAAIKSAGPRFSSRRMVKEYAKLSYGRMTSDTA